jgi:hypothetical protein
MSGRGRQPSFDKQPQTHHLASDSNLIIPRPATFQGEELLKQIKTTNAHASCNFIALRHDLVQSNTSVDSTTTPSSDDNDRVRVYPIEKIVPEGASNVSG